MYVTQERERPIIYREEYYFLKKVWIFMASLVAGSVVFPSSVLQPDLDEVSWRIKSLFPNI